MTKSSFSFSYFLLLILSIQAHALGESFSIHLVHPDNDAIVSSLKNDSDLTEYMKIGLSQDGMDIVLWAKKKAEIDIGDIERASLESSPSAPSLRPRQKKVLYQGPSTDIHIWFTPQGSKKFADFTTRNTKRKTVFILDGIAIAAPVIFEPITGGQMGISGDFSDRQAKQIVDRINELIARNKSM